MNFNDIPDKLSAQFSSTVYIKVSPDTKRKLEELKRKHKDVPKFLREIVDEALQDLEL